MQFREFSLTIHFYENKMYATNVYLKQAGERTLKFQSGFKHQMPFSRVF